MSDLQLLGRLLAYLKGEGRLLLLTILCLLVYGVVSAYTPSILAKVFDENLLEADRDGLMKNMLLLLFFYVLSLVTFRQQLIWLGQLVQKMLLKIRMDLFSNIQPLPLSFFFRNEPGDLMSRLINDTNSIGTLFSQSIAQTLGSVISLLAIIVAMLIMDWRMALATSCVIPFMIWLSIYFSKKSRKAYAISRKSLGELSSDLEENLRMIKESQAFVRQGMNIAHFEGSNANNRDASLEAIRITAIFSPTIDVLSTLAQVAVVGFGGYLVFQGLTTLGTIVAFLSYSQKFYRPIQMLASFYNQLQETLASAERVFAVIDEPKEMNLPNANANANANKDKKWNGEIRFNKVNFGYEVGAPILKNISFKAEPGQLIALVGETGVGKTTTLNLIPRYYVVQDGSITIDDVNINDMDITDLRSRIAEVPQASYLFSGSIADNIGFGKEIIDQKKVVQAAKRAQIHDYIMGLPEQYETIYGAAGVSLSEGQKQLVCIARALYADPAILLLDEATSNIDTQTEQNVQKAMAEVMQGRTSFVIAHRLNTVKQADTILVLGKEGIIEKGSHKELMKLPKGYYKELVEKQQIGSHT